MDSLKMSLFDLSISYLYVGRWKRGSFEKSILLSDKICLSKAICFRCIKVPSMQKGGHFSFKTLSQNPPTFPLLQQKKEYSDFMPDFMPLSPRSPD